MRDTSLEGKVTPSILCTRTIHVVFQEAIRNMNGGVLNPLLLPMDNMQQWAMSLPEARVTRWGGIISTPDNVLQVRRLCGLPLRV